MVGVHAGDRADEAGVADVDEWGFAVFGDDEDDGVFFEADAGHVVEDAPVEELAVFGDVTCECEAGAVEECGEVGGEAEFFFGDVGAAGEGVEFNAEFFGGVDVEAFAG